MNVSYMLSAEGQNLSLCCTSSQVVSNSGKYDHEVTHFHFYIDLTSLTGSIKTVHPGVQMSAQHGPGYLAELCRPVSSIDRPASTICSPWPAWRSTS